VSANNIFLNYLKILRFDHWIKQIFVFPGILLAIYQHSEIQVTYFFILKIIFGLLLISLTASANYCINEYLDRHNDYYHPLKKKRASIQKKLDAKIVYFVYFFLVFISLFSSIIFINVNFFLTLIIFLLFGILYNVKPIRLKDVRYLDIISESLNNPIRFILGYLMVFPIFSLQNELNINSVIFYFFFGCFLMSCKRLSEKNFLKNVTNIKKYRISISNYSTTHLSLQVFFYSLISIYFLSKIFEKNSGYTIFIVSVIICYTEYYNITLSKSYSAQHPEKLYREKKLIFLISLSIIFFFFKFLNS
jgi:decaprenyl-phosphate phosphoribosyltransferase